MTMEDMLSTQAIELATRVMHDFVVDGKINSLSIHRQEKLRGLLIQRRAELIAMLQSTDAPTRAFGVWALGYTGTFSAAERCAKMLFDAEASVRVEVVKTLSLIGSRRQEGLLARFANDTDLSVRTEALKTMRILGFGWDTAIAHLNDSEAEMRSEAVRLLNETAPDVQAKHNAKLALLKLYKSKNKIERICAIRSLGLLRINGVTQLLVDAVTDREIEVALTAARALGDVGAVASMIMATDNPEVATLVRDELIMQLGRYLQTSDAALNRLIEVATQKANFSVALRAIGMSASRGALVALQKIPLKEESKIETLFTRARLGEFEAASKLLRLTSSRDTLTGLKAAAALMELGNPAGMSVIIDALTAPKYKIRLLAAGYLAVYAPVVRDFGSLKLKDSEQAESVKNAWLAWWLENQQEFHPISRLSGDTEYATQLFE